METSNVTTARKMTTNGLVAFESWNLQVKDDFPPRTRRQLQHERFDCWSHSKYLEREGKQLCPNWPNTPWIWHGWQCVDFGLVHVWCATGSFYTFYSKPRDSESVLEVESKSFRREIKLLSRNLRSGHRRRCLLYNYPSPSELKG